ncbi:MAG: Rid family detoxifying hydrolase [Nitrosomonas sp.]|nr:Rid family detoxifying hydrolase [Nitrosomonas sp.]
MRKTIVTTSEAPQAIGTYSQAVRVAGGETVYLSGQIGLDPVEMKMVAGIDAQIEQVIANLKAVAVAGGGDLSDVVKLNVYLIDLMDFSKVNEAMNKHFSQPFPARAVIGVSALPRDALVEMDAIMVLQND